MEGILGLAPLHGVTNYIFRNVYFKYFGWIDYAVTPFIAAVKKLEGTKHVKDILPENNRFKNIIPQIMGNTSDTIIPFSKFIKSLGYNEVDWNLGCPFPMVANKQRGSGLLPYPDRINGILNDFFSATDMKLSLKIRLGRHKKDEIFDLIDVFNKYPIDKIIIHPRTGIQMYEGAVNLEVFSKVYKLLKSSVVYNGDINTRDNYLELKSKFPEIREWMIGRGAVGNPFLAAEIKGTFIEENRKREILKEYHSELMFSYQNYLSGHKHLLDKMKEVWSYHSELFKKRADIKVKIKRAHNIDAFKATINEVFTGYEFI